tara:strand:- start:456 stop:632 length:177 start_codon:yes stop_codon:yes gene_type:complete
MNVIINAINVDKFSLNIKKELNTNDKKIIKDNEIRPVPKNLIILNILWIKLSIFLYYL